MRYIKPFNEAFIQTVYNNWENIKAGDIREFGKDCLAYLFDDGFRLDVYNSSERNSAPFTYVTDSMCLRQNSLIQFSKGSPRNETFSWDDIKDYFISFLHLFINKYKLGSENNPKGPIMTDPNTFIHRDNLGNNFVGRIGNIEVIFQFEIPTIPSKRSHGVSYSDRKYSLEDILSDRIHSDDGVFEEIKSINILLS